MGKIFVVGVGPGSKGLITPVAEKVIDEAEVLVGGRDVLKKYSCGEKKVVGGDVGDVIRFIRDRRDKRLVVITSGDPCFYSLLDVILREFPKEEVEVVPGISSMQLCFARIKETLNDSTFISLHGRGLEELRKAAERKKLVILTDDKTPPNIVADYIRLHHPGKRRVYVCENLTEEAERITEGGLQDIARGRFSGNAVMVIISEEEKASPRVVPGVPDGLFHRDDAPMTKEEVRAVTLSKADLRLDSVVYDIGAGTGSISVEAGLLARRGRVYAVEKDPGRCRVVERNIMQFGLRNVKVVAGEAPEAMERLPLADRIIIGGSGDRLGGIIRKCDEKLAEEGRIVMNLIALDSLATAVKELERKGYEYETTQVTISKGARLGGKMVLRPRSTVFIITAWRMKK
jgi:precorrin-6Y C5,15-methyltransferase (decarboxylating)